MFTKHLKKYRKEVIIGPTFKLIEAIFELIVPLLMARIIDQNIPNKDLNGAFIYIGMMFLLTILGFLASITCQYYAGIVGYGMGASLRLEVFDHMMHLDDKAFDQKHKHFYVNSVTSDCEQVQNSVNMAIRLASRAPFLIIGAIILAFTINQMIGMIFLIVSLLIIVFVYMMGKYTVKHYKDSQKELDVLTRLTKEVKTGDKMIRAFSKQKDTQDVFDKEANTYDKIQRRIGKINSFLNPVNYLLINIGILIVIYLGAFRIENGLMSQGEMLALVNYFGQILMSLVIMINLVLLFTKGYASYTRIQSVMALKYQLQIESLPDIATTDVLTLSHVSFAFGQNQNVLEDLSFSLKSGNALGIIGRTGSGKSTLIRLLTRHYDPNSGDIYFKGKNLKTMDPKVLLKHFGIANQKAYLFEGTVRSNLLIANNALTDYEMVECLKQAQASFVLNHKDGLDMKISQGGLNLSGGQRQRLNIARALANHPDLLILDDSSSALDFKTDYELRKNIKKLKMTTIIIAQRIQAIKDCEQIIVLEKGLIVASGTHDELMKTNAFYQTIALAQGVSI